MSELTKFEIEILEECEGIKPARAWGAAVAAALECLEGNGLTRRGMLTDKGRAVLAEIRAKDGTVATVLNGK